MPQPAIETILTELKNSLSSPVQTNVLLSQLTRWKVGGPAQIYLEPISLGEVSDCLRILASHSFPYCIIGESSNLLFDSAGFNGAILKIASNLSNITTNDNIVVASAGTSVPTLCRRVGEIGLSGIEHAVGIPGTIGGLVLMNGGSQRKGIGSHVVWVEFADERGETHRYSHDECEFAYRKSRFQTMRGAITKVCLKLSHGDPKTIVHEMDQIVASRRKKFPEDMPNCGSTFLSNPEMYSLVGPPGQVIEEAGLKGYKVGGAQVSEKHANFVNNVNNATSDDIINIIGHIRRTVFEKTGFKLAAEARYVSPEGNIVAAHVESDRKFPLG